MSLKNGTIIDVFVEPKNCNSHITEGISCEVAWHCAHWYCYDGQNSLSEPTPLSTRNCNAVRFPNGCLCPVTGHIVSYPSLCGCAMAATGSGRHCLDSQLCFGDKPALSSLSPLARTGELGLWRAKLAFLSPPRPPPPLQNGFASGEWNMPALSTSENLFHSPICRSIGTMGLQILILTLLPQLHLWFPPNCIFGLRLCFNVNRSIKSFFFFKQKKKTKKGFSRFQHLYVYSLWYCVMSVNKCLVNAL